MNKKYYNPRISFENNKKIVTQKTTNKCNNQCIFCVVPDCFNEYEKKNRPPNTSEFKRIIDAYNEDGKNPDVISFTTAEPTLRPDIRNLLEYTVNRYPLADIKMLTNGRMFSHKEYAKSFQYLLKHIGMEIPLHGPNSSVHDKLTLKKGSFEQAVCGIRNIFDVSPSVRVNIRILVHKQNYQHLESMIDFVLREFPQVNSIILIYISMIGEVKKNYRSLFLKFSDLKKPLSDVLRNYKDKTSILLFHIPYCMVDREFWNVNPGRTLAERQIEFPEKCSGCLMMDKCCGFWKSEFNSELFEEVSPVKSLGEG